MSRHGKTAIASSGALLGRLRQEADKTLPDPTIHISLPLPERGVILSPPNGIRDPSYRWLSALHQACQKQLNRFVLTDGKCAALVSVRWLNTRKGDQQFSSVDSPYGHHTFEIGPAVEVVFDEKPVKWIVMWIDLQQGQGRSIGKLMLTWDDFTRESGKVALNKLQAVAAHIKQYAAQSCRNVAFTLQPM